MEWNPGPKYRAYLSRIQDILENGEQRTVRDCYYALEARGFPDELRQKSYGNALRKHEQDPDENPHPDNVPESYWLWEFDYSYVKRAVKKGRRSGYIDPGQIVDTSRRAEHTPYSGYEDPESFVEDEVEGLWNRYAEDFWSGQDHYVEVWLEKASLASVFAPICREWNVRLEATRGDWSDSKVYEASRRLRGKMEQGKHVRVLYFGDYNPSGFHAPVSIVQTMRHYGMGFDEWGLQDGDIDSSDPRYYDIEHDSPHTVRFYEPDAAEWSEETPDPDDLSEDAITMGSIGFDRLAINHDHIEEFDLPENPTPSSSDKDRTIRESFMRYVSEGEDANVELNALKEYEREFLEDLIRDGIREYVDDDAKGHVEQRVREAQSALEDAIQVDRDAIPTFD